MSRKKRVFRKLTIQIFHARKMEPPKKNQHNNFQLIVSSPLKSWCISSNISEFFFRKEKDEKSRRRKKIVFYDATIKSLLSVRAERCSKMMKYCLIVFDDHTRNTARVCLAGNWWALRRTNWPSPTVLVAFTCVALLPAHIIDDPVEGQQAMILRFQPQTQSGGSFCNFNIISVSSCWLNPATSSKLA